MAKINKMQKSYEVTNILWDTDGIPAENLDLPQKMTVDVQGKMPAEMQELYISDYITEQTGFCHKGFGVTPEIQQEEITVEEVA